jgi:hypothetical protein
MPPSTLDLTRDKMTRRWETKLAWQKAYFDAGATGWPRAKGSSQLFSEKHMEKYWKIGEIL